MFPTKAVIAVAKGVKRKSDQSNEGIEKRMDIWEEILTQFLGEKQTVQANGSPVSSKFACAVTELNRKTSLQMIKL